MQTFNTGVKTILCCNIKSCRLNQNGQKTSHESQMKVHGTPGIPGLMFVLLRVVLTSVHVHSSSLQLI